MSKHVLGLISQHFFVIIAHQPWGYDNIAFVHPIVADPDVGDMFGPFHTVYVSTISIVEIMISRYKEKLGKPLAESFQGSKAKIQGLEINAGSVMVPIAQEHPSVTSMFAP
jgi:hypothetical protein